MWLWFSDISCLNCQSMSVYNKHQEVYANVICHKTNGKRVMIWTREHTFMMTTQEVGGDVLEICHVFSDSIVFKQLIYCSFLKIAGVRAAKKLIIFIDVRNGWPLCKWSYESCCYPGSWGSWSRSSKDTKQIAVQFLNQLNHMDL